MTARERAVVREQLLWFIDHDTRFMGDYQAGYADAAHEFKMGRTPRPRRLGRARDGFSIARVLGWNDRIREEGKDGHGDDRAGRAQRGAGGGAGPGDGRRCWGVTADA